MRRHVLAALLGVMLAGVSSARGANMAPDLRQVLGEIADQVKLALAKQNEKPAVAIGTFTGPTIIPMSSGPGLALLLAEELEKRSVAVKADAAVVVKGNYRLTEVAAEDVDEHRLGRKMLGTAIEIVLTDRADKPWGGFSTKREVRGEATLVVVAGVTASLAPRGTERERDEQLRKSLVDPTSVIDKTVVRSQAKSPYGIEILVNDKPAAVVTKDDCAFVKLARDGQYSVRLQNDSPLEMAVQLKIDGISMFAFSEGRQPDKIPGENGVEFVNPKAGQPKYSFVIVAPRRGGTPGETIVRGWHFKGERSDAFSVGRFPGRAPGWLRSADVSTITATFQASWDKDAPVDEPGKRRCGSGDSSGEGISLNTAQKRQTGVIRDCISVRYSR